jgi:hypothetical protein
MLRDVCLEVVLQRVLSNNTDRAHLAGRALPSVWRATASNAHMEQAFFDPPQRPQGGN